MEKKQWTMQEKFIFPEHAGVPTETVAVKVTPGFTEERTEDGVRLTGIYHIAAEVKFVEGVRGNAVPESAVLIGDVDLEGGAGYFEYAVPLHIDLPPEAGSPLQVATTVSTGESDGQGSFGVKWTVECSYDEALVLEIEEEDLIVMAPVQPPAPEAVVEPVETAVTAQATEANEEPVIAAQATEPSAAAVATVDSTSFTGSDEALSFIAGLEDGITTSVFRSNDVFIKNES